MQAVSIPTKYGWIYRWWEAGLEGLANKPKNGRPPKADDRCSRTLEDVIAKETGELGYDFAILTLDRLRAHMKKETGIDLSDSRFRALLKRKGYQYRQQKQNLAHLQDKKAKAATAEVL